MANYTGETNAPDQVFLRGKVEDGETMTAKVAGTAATIESGCSFAISDQDTNTAIVTITGYDAQTVTFSGATTTAAHVATQLNAGLEGVSVEVTGDGDVKITTDATGNDQSISVAGTSATALDWDAATDGTGYPDGVEITKGMMVARTTSSSSPYSSGDVVPYDSGADPTGADTPIGVADFDLTWSSSGSKSVLIARGGVANKNMIKKLDGTTVTDAEYDKLIANSNISLVDVVDMAEYQN